MTAFPSLQQIVMSIPAVVIAFAFHEYAHALTATWFGDDTPRLQGRLTLSPLVHLDIMGTLLLLIGGFGWARPVQVDLSKVRPRVLGDIVISLAGVTMNFLLAILFFILSVMAQKGMLGYQHPVLTQTLFQVFILNLALVAFNILPIPPLDGFRVVQYLLPAGSNELVFTLYRYGPLILLVLIMTGATNYFMPPLYEGLMSAVLFIAKPVVNLLVR